VRFRRLDEAVCSWDRWLSGCPSGQFPADHRNSYEPEFTGGRTSIPVDDTTKEQLGRLKRDGETWDVFLERVTATEEPIETGAWSDEAAERAEASIRNSRANWR